MKVVWLGTGLTGVMTLILTLAFGKTALLPSLTFGALATVIQVLAVQAVKPVFHGPFKKLMLRWGLGMGLRLLGVVAIVVVVLVRRDIFPPLPTAFAYLGVLVPLLFAEIRLIR